MSVDEFAIPAHVTKYLASRGYARPTGMDAFIASWWSWYTASDKWYEVGYSTLDGNKKKRRRMTLHPARRVCREWASLLLNEDTTVSVDAPMANAWLNGADGSRGYLDRCCFWSVSQGMVEKAFALGTGAWALWFDVREDGTDVRPRTYDARMVVPLTWDDDGVTECAFVTRIVLKGKPADQLQMHVVGDAGTYVVRTAVFVDGKEAAPEPFGILPEFDTGCRTPTFGIVRPGIENVYADISPYGASVFADAIDAVKSVDLTWDAFMQEIELTGAMVFMDEALIDVKDEDGRLIPVPRGDDDHMFRKLAGQAGSELFEVYSPEIRSDPLFKAFDAALAELGDQCGFGQKYFTLDKAGGLKTATEVSSDNSALMRSIRKHEVVLGSAIKQLAVALLTCARTCCGADVEEDFGEVSVFFDDSIITDTQTEKNMMLAEIAAGVVPKWMYLHEFYGMGEDEAKAAVEPDYPAAYDFGE